MINPSFMVFLKCLMSFFKTLISLCVHFLFRNRMISSNEVLAVEENVIFIFYQKFRQAIHLSIPDNFLFCILVHFVPLLFQIPQNVQFLPKNKFCLPAKLQRFEFLLSGTKVFG